MVEIAITSGIASPSAWGQAITSTVTTRSIDERRVRSSDQPRDQRHCGRDDRDDGQEQAARSASACARERDRLRLRDEPHDAGECRLFSPVPVTSTRSEPEPLTVPAITVAPAYFGRVATRR